MTLAPRVLKVDVWSQLSNQFSVPSWNCLPSLSNIIFLSCQFGNLDWLLRRFPVTLTFCASVCQRCLRMNGWLLRQCISCSSSQTGAGPQVLALVVTSYSVPRIVLDSFHTFSFHSLKHAREVFTLKEAEQGIKSFVQDHSQKYNPDVSIA